MTKITVTVCSKHKAPIDPEGDCPQCWLEEMTHAIKHFYCPRCGKKENTQYYDGDEGYWDVKCCGRIFRVFE